MQKGIVPFNSAALAFAHRALAFALRAPAAVMHVSAATSSLAVFVALALACAAAAPAQSQSSPQTPPPQQSATSPPVRLRIGGNVAEAKLIQPAAMPVYPAIARTAHVEGTVVLHVIIGKNGNVQSADFVSGPPLLMRSAMDAVKQWRYEPTLLNGQPVEVDTTVTVVFNLGGPAASSPAPPNEEVALKDGSRISGKVVKVDGDTFTIQTSYSKIKIPRSDILSITFNENAPPPSASSASAPLPRVVMRLIDQKISNGLYTNAGGNFTLKVPDGWVPDDEMAKKVPQAIGALRFTDPHARIIIESFPDKSPPTEEMQLLESTFKSSFQEYERLSEAPVQIDGYQGDSLICRVVLTVDSTTVQPPDGSAPLNTPIKAPVKYYIVVLRIGQSDVLFICAAPEVLYDQFGPLFEQIVSSYHSTAPAPDAQP